MSLFLVRALQPKGDGAASGGPPRAYMKEFTAMTYSDEHGRGMTLWGTSANEPIAVAGVEGRSGRQLVSLRVVGAQRYHDEELQLPAFAPG